MGVPQSKLKRIFKSKSGRDTSTPSGAYIPLDEGRTPYPELPPQNVLDIVEHPITRARSRSRSSVTTSTPIPATASFQEHHPHPLERSMSHTSASTPLSLEPPHPVEHSMSRTTRSRSASTTSSLSPETESPQLGEHLDLDAEQAYDSSQHSATALQSPTSSWPLDGDPSRQIARSMSRISAQSASIQPSPMSSPNNATSSYPLEFFHLLG
jgi:hypothetical protein